MAKFLSATHVCDHCDKPLIEAEAPTLTATDDQGVWHLLHEACLAEYAAKLGWEDV